MASQQDLPKQALHIQGLPLEGSSAGDICPTSFTSPNYLIGVGFSSIKQYQLIPESILEPSLQWIKFCCQIHCSWLCMEPHWWEGLIDVSSPQCPNKIILDTLLLFVKKKIADIGNSSGLICIPHLDLFLSRWCSQSYVQMKGLVKTDPRRHWSLEDSLLCRLHRKELRSVGGTMDNNEGPHYRFYSERLGIPLESMWESCPQGITSTGR